VVRTAALLKLLAKTSIQKDREDPKGDAMRKWKVIVFAVCCASTYPAWGDTGLIVQKVIPASGGVVSGNTIASRGTVAGTTDIYENDGSGNWNLTQTLPVAGPMAISGNTLLLGNVGSDPAFTASPALVYVSDANGNWTQQASLVNSTDFGKAVALDGDTAVVGDYWVNHASNLSSFGAVYIFQRDTNGSWTQAQELLPPALGPSGTPVLVFGALVAISGRTLLVYAQEEVPVGNNTINTNGQIYVYSRQNDGSWAFQTVLPAGYMPLSLTAAVHGSNIAVQTPSSDNTYFNVDTYAPNGAGGWTMTQALAGAPVQVTGQPGQQFGNDIRLGGPFMLVEAASQDTGGGTTCGIVCGGLPPPSSTMGGLYAYTLNGGSWQPINVYAPQSMTGIIMDSTAATDGVTVIADASFPTNSSMQGGMVVMQQGSVPASGYAVVPSYTPAQTSGSTPTQGGMSGGGSFGWETLLLSAVWFGRRRSTDSQRSPDIV
jgi:hypothetical protein